MSLTRGAAIMFLAMLLTAPLIAAEQSPEARWLSRFSFVPPAANHAGKCARSDLGLPRFTVTQSTKGEQIVRVSLPFPCGSFPSGKGLVVRRGTARIVPDVRVLTLHPGTPKMVRRAILTFPFRFASAKDHDFRLELSANAPDAAPASPAGGRFAGRIGSTDIRVEPDTVTIKRGGVSWVATLVAPDRYSQPTAKVEVIERGSHYLWVRLLIPDSVWPRIIEVRADSLGSVAVRAHLQRHDGKDGSAPEFGWRIAGPPIARVVTADGSHTVAGETVRHAFGGGERASVESSGWRLSFPDAHMLRRGRLDAVNGSSGGEVVYLRSLPEENVPMQDAAWREAAFVVSAAEGWVPDDVLDECSYVKVDRKYFDSLYGGGQALKATTGIDLSKIVQVHRDWIAQSAATGDDLGNVIGYPAGVFGMNRLNHCPAIFDEYYRCSDRRLRDVALRWCGNFHDLSIWWGENREGEFGGTRYNNVRAMNGDHKGDTSFMWRSNSAVSFCTKGYDSFFHAYEETGDPRMATALRWQVEYAKKSLHAGQQTCRNVGDVADFLALYRFTGDEAYLREGLRLFRELRECLSEDSLFAESGLPLDPDPPFIDDDKAGYNHPFAKPYIIGYALAGLPELAGLRPNEPRLRDTVRAVADFLASSQDPVGGWRYPHPNSCNVLVNQGIEHAAQLARAAAYLEKHGEPMDNLLDAIERALQARILGWRRSGQILSGVNGWEQAAGILKDGKTVYDLYKRPADRDPSRDYTEGSIGLGYSGGPEGIVYFSEVLAYYLAHRPAQRLFTPNDCLAKVLARIPERQGQMKKLTGNDYLKHGMSDMLPTFNAAQVGRMPFPLAYDPAKGLDFAKWRVSARKKLLECLLAPPPAPESFDAVVIAREDRGSYEARKLAFNVSADCRVPAYLLVPKGKGPFPAIIALHDHGAHFSIGKEKVVKPFGVSPEVLADSEQWVGACYGGRYVGDELAKRGYVVFAMDALFWGERGRLEGVSYEAQQELAANLLQLGMSWSGVITWDDTRSADFVASLPEVDRKRIGAVGLSMGAHRTWMLSAASDRIAAGAAICWMATTKSLMVPGNNQTKGQSSFSMIVPGLRNYLDYPDVASIACPKPMLFFNGTQDGLFPVDGVKDAYARMRGVWESQAASGKLVTKLWERPHVFDQPMQEESFAWLDGQLSKDERSR